MRIFIFIIALFSLTWMLKPAAPCHGEDSASSVCVSEDCHPTPEECTLPSCSCSCTGAVHISAALTPTALGAFSLPAHDLVSSVYRLYLANPYQLEMIKPPIVLPV